MQALGSDRPNASNGRRGTTGLAPPARWGLGALLGLVALVYWPGLGGGFDFDDFPNIVENTALHVSFSDSWRAWLAATFSSPASDLQRPLAMLSFAVNHALTGLAPYWMKATNLAIHLVNTVLVWLLARRLLGLAGVADERRDAVALWIAAFWSLACINLLSVLFVVQRMESLCHTFVLAGLLLYLAGRARLSTARGGGWWRILAGLVGGTGLGLLAKESAVLLPVYTLLLELTLLRKQREEGSRRGLSLLYAAVLVLPAIAGICWVAPGLLSGDAYASRTFTLHERLLTEGRVLLSYLRWTVLPDPGQLSLYHDDYTLSHGWLSPTSTLFAWLALASLAGLAIATRVRRPLLAIGIGWFLTAHLLTGTVIPLEPVYEHRNYFASFGIAIALADILALAPRVVRRRRIALVTAIALLSWQAMATALRVQEWSNPLRHAFAEAAKHPQSPRAAYLLAWTLVVVGDYQADSPYTQRAWKALDAAMRIPGASPLPESTALLLASRTGTSAQLEWWRRLREKLRENPIGPQEAAALEHLVACEIEGHCHFPKEEMIPTFLAALHARPSAEVLSSYGNYALNILRDPTLAERLWREAADRSPRTVEYQVSMAKLMIAMGRPSEALPYIARIRAAGRIGQTSREARLLENRLPPGMRPQTRPGSGR